MITRLKKSYSELMEIDDYYDRIDYLKTHQKIGEATFGGRRSLNQVLYHTQKWLQLRKHIMIRDSHGDDFVFDLGHNNYPIDGVPVIIHHINPISVEDVLRGNPLVWDKENLICTTDMTHKIIHYEADGFNIRKPVIERSPGDTRLW